MSGGAPGLVNSGGSKAGLLAQIERGTYVLESEMGRLNEKGIAVLRGDLAALEQECREELRRSVFANYRPYIKASQASYSAGKN